MSDKQMLMCSCCKQEKQTSCFSKCPTKRGYNYHCKVCVNERKKENRKQITTPNEDTNIVIGSNQDNSMVLVIMECALKYTSTFEQFVQVISSFKNVVDFQMLCDISFKYCRQNYPECYKTLITTMLEMLNNDAQNDIQNDAQNDIQNDAQNEIQSDAQNEIQSDAQNEIQNDAQNEIQSDAQNTKFNITQSYINQYKNDANMKQLGEDIESDDEYSIMTVRSGDKWCKVRVKKQ